MYIRTVVFLYNFMLAAAVATAQMKSELVGYLWNYVINIIIIKTNVSSIWKFVCLCAICSSVL